MPARRRTVLFVACVALACVAAGCGGSGAPPQHKVTLSITAPTDGATLGVRQLQVAGTVVPANAAVTIGGRQAQVRNGRFQLPMQLDRATETITITGQAPGYQPARAATTVSFSIQTASSIRSARRVATTDHTRTVRNSVPAFLGPAFQWPGGIGGSTASVAPAPAPAPGASGASPGTGAPDASPGAGGGEQSSPGTPVAAPTTSPTGGSPAGGGAASSPAPAPVSQPWTPGRVRNVYLQLCIHGKDAVTAFCRCTYQRMARAGALRSRTSLLSLVRKLKRFARTHNVMNLPRFMRGALFNCVQTLPGNDPATPLPVKRLPGQHHPASSSPSPTAVPSPLPTSAPSPTPSQTTTTPSSPTSPTTPSPAPSASPQTVDPGSWFPGQLTSAPK